MSKEMSAERVARQRESARILGNWLFENYPTGEPDIAVATLDTLKRLHAAQAVSLPDRETLAKLIAPELFEEGVSVDFIGKRTQRPVLDAADRILAALPPVRLAIDMETLVAAIVEESKKPFTPGQTRAEWLASVALAALSTQPAAGEVEEINGLTIDDWFKIAQAGDEANASAVAAIDDLADAIRLTVEYVGNDTLPALKGWSWFDALMRQRPEIAEEFESNPILLYSKRAPVASAADELPTADGPAPELFPGTLTALDRLTIRPEVQS